MQIELFHNAEQGRDYGTATLIKKTATGSLLLRRQVLTSPAPTAVVVRHASLAAYVNGPAVNVPADVRLWQYRDIHVTSRDGTHGTLLGPWSVTRFAATRDGTPTGKVAADTILWHGGAALGLWLRATS